MAISSSFENLKISLKQNPKTWLVTGAAGFIGSHLIENLLKLQQRVVGLDNFSTGHQHNLDQVKALVEPEQWQRFLFIEGDISDIDTCSKACTNVDYVLHQAALGSVPRSLSNPIATNHANITGFLNMLVAAKDAQVKSFTYAASSSTYGDHPDLPKQEDTIGNPLSPYAVTKLVNEQYAAVFARCYGFKTIGLRYFNIFGPRQDPNGAYAAVIPLWMHSILNKNEVYINGDGQTSRDFCFVNNAVQANLLAAAANDESKDQVYNIAVGDQTSLTELYAAILGNVRNHFSSHNFESAAQQPIYRDFRSGDVRHSKADISKAKSKLGYQPSHNISEGLIDTVAWYCEQNK